MATATMTYVGTADGAATTLTHTGSIPDALSPNFFNAYRAQFGQIQDKDASGALLYWDNSQTPPVKTATPPTGIGRGGAMPVMRDMTDAETWERYTQGIAAGTASFVQNYMVQQAKAAAEASAQAQIAQAVVTQTA